MYYVNNMMAYWKELQEELAGDDDVDVAVIVGDGLYQGGEYGQVILLCGTTLNSQWLKHFCFHIFCLMLHEPCKKTSVGGATCTSNLHLSAIPNIATNFLSNSSTVSQSTSPVK